MDSQVICLSRAAGQLGIGRQTLAEVVQKLGLPYKRVPYHSGAKGLTPQDMEIISGRLKPIESPPVAASA